MSNARSLQETGTLSMRHYSPVRSSSRWLALVSSVLLAAVLNASAAAGDNVSDARISDEIQDDLSVDQVVSSHLIDVEVDNGIVELTGSVSNLDRKSVV